MIGVVIGFEPLLMDPPPLPMITGEDVPNAPGVVEFGDWMVETFGVGANCVSVTCSVGCELETTMLSPPARGTRQVEERFWLLYVPSSSPYLTAVDSAGAADPRAWIDSIAA